MMVAAGFAAFAQDAAEAPAPESTEALTPEIYFEKTVHDFGAISHRGNGTCEFVFTNTGKVPLLLTNASASCGCTVPSYDKTPIAPGATGKVTVRYDTNRIGGFHKSITITSNAKTNPNVVLYIKGEVKAAEAAPAAAVAK